MLFEKRRVPELLTDLKSQNSRLNTQLDKEAYTGHMTRAVVHEIHATLVSLKGKITSDCLETALGCAKEVLKPNPSNEALEELYGAVGALTVSLTHRIKDNELDVTQ